MILITQIWVEEIELDPSSRTDRQRFFESTSDLEISLLAMLSRANEGEKQNETSQKGPSCLSFYSIHPQVLPLRISELFFFFFFSNITKFILILKTRTPGEF